MSLFDAEFRDFLRLVRDCWRGYETWILYSLIELDGGERRRQVLQNIQKNDYWRKNDDNDKKLESRNEKSWRNDFSYERQHLVDAGYMQKDTPGRWEITESGRNYFSTLVEKAKKLESSEDILYTPFLYQRLLSHEIHSEEAADQLLLERIASSNETQKKASILLIDEPLPKGSVYNRAGNKNRLYCRYS